MLRTSWFFAFVCVFIASIQSAFATVQVHVDISTQTMTVVSNSGTYSWPVSTGRAGFATPQGTYRPQRMMAVAFSAKYHNSPMPHSIFFRGGYAIHGSYNTGHLGRRASHGCIRLAPGNAATLFSLVKSEGAVISIGGRNSSVYAGRQSSKGKSRIASRGHQKNLELASYHPNNTRAEAGYLAYTSQGEPAPVRQWQADPFAEY